MGNCKIKLSLFWYLYNLGYGIAVIIILHPIQLNAFKLIKEEFFKLEDFAMLNFEVFI